MEHVFWKTKIIEICKEYGYPDDLIEKLNSMEKQRVIKNYIYLNLKGIHKSLDKNGIKFLPQKVELFLNYQNRLIEFLTEKNVEKKHINVIKKLQFRSEISSYIDKHLANFKGQLMLKRIELPLEKVKNKKTNLKKPGECYDRTVNSIKAINTPMGNKR